MKLLHLTSIITKPNEVGQQKIKKALKQGISFELESDTDSEGNYTKKWFLDNNLKVPKHLLNEDDNLEISDEGTILLREGEFEYEGVDLVFKLDDFSSCIDNEQMGCVIYSTSGDEYWVFENSEEVADYINWLTTSDFKKWWVGVKISVSDFFRRKNKITYQEILDRPENKQ